MLPTPAQAAARAPSSTAATASTRRGRLRENYLDVNDVHHGYVRHPDGTITEFDAPGAGTEASQGTHNFGINPAGTAAGNLYGTTESGGAFNSGVVFKLDPSGQETVLYSFTGGADGGVPTAGLVMYDYHG